MKAKDWIATYRGLRWPWKLAAWAAAMLAAYALAGFFVLPPLSRMILEKKLPTLLHRQAVVGKVACNPFTLSLEIRDFHLKTRDGKEDFASFERLFVDLEAVSLFKLAPVIRTVTLSEPRVKIIRDKDLSYNFSDLLPPAGKEEKKAGGAPLRFSISGIAVTDGAMDIEDLSMGTRHELRELIFAMPLVSSMPEDRERHARFSLGALVNDAPLAISGEAKPFVGDRETRLRIDLRDCDLTHYLSYLPQGKPVRPRSGVLGATILASLRFPDGKKPAIHLSGNAALRESAITDGAGETFLQVPELNVDAAGLRISPLSVDLTRVVCRRPHLKIKRDEAGTLWPFSLFAGNEEAPNSGQAGNDGDTSAQVAFSARELLLEEGSVDFVDDAVAPRFSSTVTPIDLKVHGFTTAEGKTARYALSLAAEAEQSLAARGEFDLSPLLVRGDATLSSLDLARLAPYLEKVVSSRIAGGTLGVEGLYEYSLKETTQEIRISGLGAKLEEFQMRDGKDDEPLIELPRLVVEDAGVDFQEKTIHIGRVISTGGRLALIREADGAWNMARAFKPPREKNEGESVPAPPVKEPKGEEEPSWRISLKRGEITGHSVDFIDNLPKEVARFNADDVKITLDDFDTSPGNKSTVAVGFRLNGKGVVDCKGTAGIDPLAAALNMDLQGIGIQEAQPYLAPHVNVTVDGGAVSIKGDLTLETKEGREGLSTTFTGSVAVADFASRHGSSGEKLVNWKGLDLQSIAYDSSARSLDIGEIIWKDGDVHIVIGKDGRANLASLLPPGKKPEAEPDRDAEEKAGGHAITVRKMTLTGGNLDFLDNSITPHYAASLGDIHGTVTDLSSKEGPPATINLAAKLDQYAPLNVTGSVDPLRENIFADLTLEFKGVDLSPLSPYSGKFIGYKTDKGKLSLNLRYLIEDGKLSAENKAFLDQLTIGDAVESPTALKLPLHLAIALLKNRKGEITLNVPVEGNLRDPEFSIGGIIAKAFVSFIAKAATSPFALLGALIPKGEELHFIEFPPGSDIIGEQYAGRLKTLAKALYERPSLKIDIAGGVDPASDGAALREADFMNLLRKAKHGELTARGTTPLTTEETVVSGEEYETYLKKAYAAAFPDADMKAPLDEMARLLRERADISADDLRLLAVNRAKKVKDFLLEAGPVEQERIFTTEPRGIAASGEKASEEKRRVTLSVK